jgi:hypothetical protein
MPSARTIYNFLVSFIPASSYQRTYSDPTNYTPEPSTMTTHVMPIRGESGAPTFDQKQPHDIEQYFDLLETLFTRCKIETDAEKKKFAVSFVESEVAD